MLQFSIKSKPCEIAAIEFVICSRQRKVLSCLSLSELGGNKQALSLCKSCLEVSPNSLNLVFPRKAAQPMQLQKYLLWAELQGSGGLCAKSAWTHFQNTIEQGEIFLSLQIVRYTTIIGNYSTLYMDFKHSLLALALESSKMSISISAFIQPSRLQLTWHLLGEVSKFNILFSVTKVLINLCLYCYVFLKYPLKTS